METRLLLATSNVDLLDLVLATLDNLEECDQCTALVVGEIHRQCVGNPAMDTTTTRVDPEEVLEAECF